MAIRVQDGRKRPFFVYWTNPFTGRRESVSCETREEAEKQDALIKYQLKYERDAFRRSVAPEPPAAAHTLESVMYLYLKDRRLTLHNLEKTLHHVRPILAAFGTLTLDAIDAGRLEKMRDTMQASGLSPATMRRRIGIVSAALRWAERQGLLASAPRFPELPTIRHARHVPPTPEEVAALFHAAPPHLQRVIILGYYAGLRVGPSEMFRLSWNDIDLDAGCIRIPNADKGAREPWREVPILPQIDPLLHQWRADDAHAGNRLVVHYRGSPVRGIKTAWRATLRRAGIQRHIRPYDLRHGFATQLIAGGADVGTVATLMGHASPVMTLRHYQHVLTRQKREAIAALPPLPECVQIDVCKQ